MRSPTLVESPEPSYSTTPEPSSSSVMSSVPASTAGTRSYWGWQTAMGLFPGYAVHTGPAPRVKSSASTDTSSAASSFPWRQACAQPGWFWMWQRPMDTSVPGLTRWPMPVSMARLESVPSGAWSSSAIIVSAQPSTRFSASRRQNRCPLDSGGHLFWRLSGKTMDIRSAAMWRRPAMLRPARPALPPAPTGAATAHRSDSWAASAAASAHRSGMPADRAR